MKRLLLPLIIAACIASCNPAEKTSPPKKREAKVEVIGLGGTCLKCGQDFAIPPDEVLTPLCPDCQRKR